MFDVVRGEPSLFKSLRAATEMMYRRDTTLREEYKTAAALALGKQPVEISLEDTAPPELIPPTVARVFHDQIQASAEMPPPKQCPLQRPTDHVTYVMEDRADLLVVDPDKLLSGNYEEACDCMNNANVPLFCKHVQRCLCDNRSNWRFYAKYYQRPGAWRLQSCPAWQPPGAAHALEGAKELHGRGEVCDYGGTV